MGGVGGTFSRMPTVAKMQASTAGAAYTSSCNTKNPPTFLKARNRHLLCQFCVSCTDFYIDEALFTIKGTSLPSSTSNGESRFAMRMPSGLAKGESKEDREVI